MELKERLEEELKTAKQVRDELRLQIQLGKAEAKELFQRTEHKLNQVESTLKQVASETGKPLREIGQSTRDLLHEVRVGFGRVKELL